MNRELCRPFLKWAGAKTKVMPALLEVFPANATRFIEPFVGSGAVFLNTNYKVNLLSDANEDIVNLYKILKRDCEEFIHRCRAFFGSSFNKEDKFYALREQFNATQDPEIRAPLFVYLNRHCYNGLCRYNQQGFFNTPFGRYSSPQLQEDAMRGFAAKLKSAQILHVDFRDALSSAGRGDLVYCDPPYVPLSGSANFTAYSTNGFSEADQRALVIASQNAASRGATVVISNHDTPFTRALYSHASDIRAVSVARTISCDGATRNRAMELIVRFGDGNQTSEPVKPIKNSLREWLIASGYSDVNDLIEDIMADWKTRGKKTRRDWWEVLAGTFGGKGRKIEGRTMPVLAAARHRMGWPKVESAVCRNADQPVPTVAESARWRGHQKKEKSLK